jgi:SLOG family YspA-like protein
MPERIAIVGSRHFPRPELVEAFVASLPAGTIVVSGGAQGVDTAAEEAAQARGLETLIFHADWKRHGRKAGQIRNAEIVAHADRIVAFWDGRSQGTLNTIVQALGANLPVEIFDSDGDPVLIDDVT